MHYSKIAKVTRYYIFLIEHNISWSKYASIQEAIDTSTTLEVVCMLGLSVATYSGHMTCMDTFLYNFHEIRVDCVTQSYLTGVNKLFQYYKLKLVRKSTLKQLCLRPSYI